jgi:hypothetical protein
MDLCLGLLFYSIDLHVFFASAMLLFFPGFIHEFYLLNFPFHEDTPQILTE